MQLKNNPVISIQSFCGFVLWLSSCTGCKTILLKYDTVTQQMLRDIWSYYIVNVTGIQMLNYRKYIGFTSLKQDMYKA